MEAALMAEVHRPRASTSGWEGNAAFGGIVLVLAGGYHVLTGFVAIFNDGYFLVSSQDLLVSVDYTAWGWLHLVLGAIAAVVGGSVLRGKAWARMAGVVLAGLSALVNLAFIASFPLWSMLIIALDLVVIYSLVAPDRYSSPAR
jgi:hypothetical protein